MERVKLADRLKDWTSGDRRVRLIMLLGLLGMALILLSQIFSALPSRESEVDTATADFVSEQYIEALEEKLTGLVGGIEGVGQAHVMVTLQSGVEYVYAQEEKRNTDTSREGGATEVSGRVYEKENVEQTYILVEQNGAKQPVVVSERQPRVQGVVIVCEGADNIRVEQSLINVVTTALNIPSNRVCVVKIDAKELNKQEEEAQ